MSYPNKIVCYCERTEATTSFIQKITEERWPFALVHSPEEIKQEFLKLKDSDVKLLIVDKVDVPFLNVLKKNIFNLHVSYFVYSDLKNVVVNEKIDSLKDFGAIQNLNYVTEADLFLWKELVKSIYKHNSITFSVEHALGVQLNNVEIKNTAEIDSVFNKIDEALENNEVKSFQKDYYMDVITELTFNAIFDAPHNEHGQKKYYHVDRTIPLTLSQNETVSLKWGIDDKFLICQVTDKMGKLQFEHLLKTIYKCYAIKDDVVNVNKNEGGGLGFYKIIHSVNNIIINCSKDEYTEITCLITRELSRKDFRLNPKNIHFNIINSARKV